MHSRRLMVIMKTRHMLSLLILFVIRALLMNAGNEGLMVCHFSSTWNVTRTIGSFHACRMSEHEKNGAKLGSRRSRLRHDQDAVHLLSMTKRRFNCQGVRCQMSMITYRFDQYPQYYREYWEVREEAFQLRYGADTSDGYRWSGERTKAYRP